MRVITKTAIAASALVVMLALAPLSAEAHHHHHHHMKMKGPKTGPGKNDLTSLQWYITGGMFCSSIWTIGHAAYVGHTLHRELTYREAYNDIAGCWLPVVGPMLVNRWLPANY